LGVIVADGLTTTSIAAEAGGSVVFDIQGSLVVDRFGDTITAVHANESKFHIFLTLQAE
jgi:hypothetical protein